MSHSGARPSPTPTKSADTQLTPTRHSSHRSPSKSTCTALSHRHHPHLFSPSPARLLTIELYNQCI